MIRDVTLDDADAICEIYKHYILNTNITFEETPVAADQMRQRITTVTASYPWLVATDNDQIQGYAYVGRWHERAAFRHSVECAIYLDAEVIGKGIGKALLSALMDRVRQTDIHAVIAAITLPNEPSICLHEKFGFEQVGHFKQTGYKFNGWIDVGYWQLLIPR